MIQWNPLKGFYLRFKTLMEPQKARMWWPGLVVDVCVAVKGTWEGWEPWSLCNPSCGETSSRFRRRYCKPDYSEYKWVGLLPKGVSVSTGGKCWLSVTDVCWDNFNQGPEFLQQTEGTPELSLNTRTHVFVLTISLHGDEPEVSHSLNKCPLQTW